MANIININGKFNGDITNPKLKKLSGLFDKYLENSKDIIMDVANIKNYSYLLNNYISINKSFNNNDKDDENIDKFANLVCEVIDLFKRDDQKVYAILFSYNLYRIYGAKLLTLTPKDLSIVISLFLVFEQENKITYLNKIADFIFDDNLRKDLYRLNRKECDLVTMLEVAIEDYLIYGICDNRPVNCFVKEEIDRYKRSLFSKVGNVSLDNTYETFKNNVELFASFLINTKNYENAKIGYAWLSSLEKVRVKLKNMGDENKMICVSKIENIWQSIELTLKEKIDLSFNIIDEFCLLSSMKHK